MLEDDKNLNSKKKIKLQHTQIMIAIINKKSHI